MYIIKCIYLGENSNLNDKFSLVTTHFFLVHGRLGPKSTLNLFSGTPGFNHHSVKQATRQRYNLELHFFMINYDLKNIYCHKDM